MLKYPCLVLDHDDTTVNSTATVHYPCFVEYMEKYFPDVHLTLEEYFRYNFDPGVVEMFTKICGMTWEQMLDEEAYWKEYVRHHVPSCWSRRSGEGRSASSAIRSPRTSCGTTGRTICPSRT